MKNTLVISQNPRIKGYRALMIEVGTLMVEKGLFSGVLAQIIYFKEKSIKR
jgi:hypothetical protein